MKRQLGGLFRAGLRGRLILDCMVDCLWRLTYALLVLSQICNVEV